ncbi:carbohydrate-binding-like protein [Scenedesmus sp. NREL 46B-D3]|nr:carbohydrate-binding-like protein [Scenedesmus sp. NREL 46B-D3]
MYAHELLPASWRGSLNGNRPATTEPTATTNGSSGNSSANGDSKHGFSSNSGPVQSYQALFQEHAAGAGGGSSSSMQRLASLRFSVVRAVEFGQKLRLVGSPDCLGAWDAARGPDMKWHEGHKWAAHADVAAGSHAFKFVVVHRSGEVEWEPGSNRVLEVPASAAEMQVAGQWGDTSDTETLTLSEQPVVSKRRRDQQQLVEAAQGLLLLVPSNQLRQQQQQQPQRRCGV